MSGPFQVLPHLAGPGFGIVVTADVEVLELVQQVAVFGADDLYVYGVGRAEVSHAPSQPGDERRVGEAVQIQASEVFTRFDGPLARGRGRGVVKHGRNV